MTKKDEAFWELVAPFVIVVYFGAIVAFTIVIARIVFLLAKAIGL